MSGDEKDGGGGSEGAEVLEDLLGVFGGACCRRYCAGESKKEWNDDGVTG
jgi:hypothetical protein